MKKKDEAIYSPITVEGMQHLSFSLQCFELYKISTHAIPPAGEAETYSKFHRSCDNWKHEISGQSLGDLLRNVPDSMSSMAPAARSLKAMAV